LLWQTHSPFFFGYLAKQPRYRRVFHPPTQPIGFQLFTREKITLIALLSIIYVLFIYPFPTNKCDIVPIISNGVSFIYPITTLGYGGAAWKKSGVT